MTCRVSADPEGRQPTTLALKTMLLAARQRDQRGESALAEIDAVAVEAKRGEAAPKYS